MDMDIQDTRMPLDAAPAPIEPTVGNATATEEAIPPTPMDMENNEEEPIDIMTNNTSPSVYPKDLKQDIMRKESDTVAQVVGKSAATEVVAQMGAEVGQAEGEKSFVDGEDADVVIDESNEILDVSLIQVGAATGEELNCEKVVEALEGKTKPQEQVSTEEKLSENPKLNDLSNMNSSPSKKLEVGKLVQHEDNASVVVTPMMGAGNIKGIAMLAASEPITTYTPKDPSPEKPYKLKSAVQMDTEMAEPAAPVETVLPVALLFPPPAEAQADTGAPQEKEPSPPAKSPMHSHTLPSNTQRNSVQQTQLPGGLLVRSFRPAQTNNKPSRLSRLGPSGVTPQRSAAAPTVATATPDTAAKTPMSTIPGAIRPSLAPNKESPAGGGSTEIQKSMAITPQMQSSKIPLAAFSLQSGPEINKQAKSTDASMVTPIAPIKTSQNGTTKLQHTAKQLTSATPVPFTPAGNVSKAQEVGRGAMNTPSSVPQTRIIPKAPLKGNSTANVTLKPIHPPETSMHAASKTSAITVQHPLTTSPGSSNAHGKNVTPIQAVPQPPPASSAPTPLNIIPNSIIPSTDDPLLEIDFSARGDAFLAGLDDEIAATNATLAINVSDKAFSLSTTVAAIAVERECLAKKVEEVEMELSMLRVKYALDAAEVVVRSVHGAAARIKKGTGGSSSSVKKARALDAVPEMDGMEIDEHENMDIDIEN